ncbi:MAG: amidohydrolase family protein [Terriglobales bacterium]
MRTSNRSLAAGVRLAAWLALALSVGTAAAVAQAAPKRLVVRAARMLDVKTGRYVASPEIVIEGEKIVSINAGEGAGATSGAEVINLPGMTLLPGLIDVHTHITFDPSQFGYPSLGISIPRQTLYGAKFAKITLEAGFTTIRNVGARGYSDVALRDAINAGDVPGPRMMVSGPALSITGGHCDENLLAVRISRYSRRSGRWGGGGAAQGAGDHQVRRGRHQGMRDGRSALKGR